MRETGRKKCNAQREIVSRLFLETISCNAQREIVSRNASTGQFGCIRIFFSSPQTPNAFVISVGLAWVGLAGQVGFG